jgi:hypothetical protein
MRKGAAVEGVHNVRSNALNHLAQLPDGDGAKFAATIVQAWLDGRRRWNVLEMVLPRPNQFDFSIGVRCQSVGKCRLRIDE